MTQQDKKARSGPQTKILLDTTSYLRLAQNIHPLLFQPFGEEDFTLYVHSDVVGECQRQPRLANKFDWIMLPEFVENRRKPLKLNSKQTKEIHENLDFVLGHIWAETLPISRTDAAILATALALGIRFVSDDVALIELANEYGVLTWTSLELMKAMFDRDSIDIDKVEMVVEQWVYDGDLPAKALRGRYEEFFGGKPPAGF